MALRILWRSRRFGSRWPFLGGPVFGLSGAFRESHSYRRRIAATALLCGTIISEGLFFASASPFFVATASFRAAGYVEVGIGILVGVLLPRSRSERLGSLLMVPLFVLADVIAYQGISALVTRL
jgi:uncharacterized protein DUF6518